MEAETTAAASLQRQEDAEEARAKAAAAEESDAAAEDQPALNRKAEATEAKAEAARDKANKAAEDSGQEPRNLEPLACDVMPRRGLARKADGGPTKKTQRNFTDPDSHLIQSGGSYLQGYNCQLAVDSDNQGIVDVGVINQPPVFEHIELMLQRIAAIAGVLPEVMTLDASYWSEDDAKACTDQGTDAYIATGRLPHRPHRRRREDRGPEMQMPSPDGPQAQKQEGIQDLPPAQGDRGANERPDQGMPRPAALSIEGPGGGRR